MDTFACPGCSKELPAKKAVRIPVIASIELMIITLGGVLFDKVCPECQSTWWGSARSALYLALSY